MRAQTIIFWILGTIILLSVPFILLSLFPPGFRLKPTLYLISFVIFLYFLLRSVSLGKTFFIIWFFVTLLYSTYISFFNYLEAWYCADYDYRGCGRFMGDILAAFPIIIFIFTFLEAALLSYIRKKENAKTKTDLKAINSFIIGIVAVIGYIDNFWFGFPFPFVSIFPTVSIFADYVAIDPLFGFLLPFLGLILGINGLKSAERRLAKIGITMCIIAFFLPLLFLILYFFVP